MDKLNEILKSIAVFRLYPEVQSLGIDTKFTAETVAYKKISRCRHFKKTLKGKLSPLNYKLEKIWSVEAPSDKTLPANKIESEKNIADDEVPVNLSLLEHLKNLQPN